MHHQKQADVPTSEMVAHHLANVGLMPVKFFCPDEHDEDMPFGHLVLHSSRVFHLSSRPVRCFAARS